MPAAGAHYEFGQLALSQSPCNQLDCVNSHRNMFDLGTQGPDILFFYRPYHKNPVSSLGTCLHNESGAAFFSPLLPSRPNWLPALTAYLLGVCCHYVLDSTCHPLINQLAPDTHQHHRIEAALDRLIFDRYEQTIPRHLMVPKSIDITALQSVYPQLAVSLLKESAVSIHYYTRLLEHPKLVGSLERLLGKRGAFSNMCVPPQLSPSDDAHQILPLFEGAIPRAAQLMAFLLDPHTTLHQIEWAMEKNFEGQC